MYLLAYLHYYFAVTIDKAYCEGPARTEKFLGIIPKWYEYIKEFTLVENHGSSFTPQTCGIVGGDPFNHAIAIGLALIDILLRVGALAAVVFIIMGGYRYISSQGEPKNIEAAMATIVNAVIGLAIVVSAAVLVAFIGNTLGG